MKKRQRKSRMVAARRDAPAYFSVSAFAKKKWAATDSPNGERSEAARVGADEAAV